MIGGENLERAVLQALPDILLVILVPRRRGADVFGAAQRMIVMMPDDILGREEEVLRAGLAVNLQAAALRPADLLGALAVRDMGDQDRDVHHLGQADRAVRRFAVADMRT